MNGLTVVDGKIAVEWAFRIGINVMEKNVLIVNKRLFLILFLVVVSCSTRYVDKFVRLNIDAAVKSENENAVAGVTVYFKDVGLSPNSSSKEEDRIGETDENGKLVSMHEYWWGFKYRGQPPKTDRTFQLIFKKAGFKDEARTYDLDSLQKLNNDYQVKTELTLQSQSSIP
jgi:hypothetical protein